MVKLLTKNEQLIIIEMFKNYKNKYKLDISKIEISNSHLYTYLNNLFQLGLISIKPNSKDKREKIYQLTDLGQLLGSVLSERKYPKIKYWILE